jgi:hypothetical protein
MTAWVWGLVITVSIIVAAVAWLAWSFAHEASRYIHEDDPR